MGVITYKCPNCGGGLTFNADIQKYRCEYCLSEFSQEELDLSDKNVKSYVQRVAKHALGESGFKNELSDYLNGRAVSPRNLRRAGRMRPAAPRGQVRFLGTRRS